MFGKNVVLLAFSIMALSLWGCSADFDAENNQSSGTAGSVVEDNSSVGAGNCIGCHEALDVSNGTTVIADFLAGKHVIHSTHIDATDGDCLKCHDPFEDGRSLESFIEAGSTYDPALVDPTVVEADYLPVSGLAAVTCENCHGAGGDHPVTPNGLPVPYKKPDYNRCGLCHNADFFHRDHGHTAEEDNIVEDYSASKHFSGAIRNTAVCVKCHTDEGARLYIDKVTANDLTTTTAVTEANRIQCRTCHNSHNNGKLLKADTLNDPDPDLRASAEYNTCTTCHQRHDAKIGAIANGVVPVGSSIADGASGELIFHAGNWDRVISSTHWDDPATSYQANAADPLIPNIVEGYAIDPTNERACRDCHNVHGADATINKQWAKSAHGSKIREAKEDAAGPRELQDPLLPAFTNAIDQLDWVRRAGANGDDHALPHYDWDAANRSSCQMCHTSTGAKNFLNDQAAYDPANNDFSHLDGWVAGVSSSGQNELIYCWACHSDNSGALRNPGAVSSSYAVDSVNPVLPDLGKTNVCVNCHNGRGNMDSYALTGDPSSDMSSLKPGFGPGTKNVTATHYMAASATIYQATTKVGYEYAGLSYADKPYYRHKLIGLNNDSPETGSGPCATCHMTDKNHTFAVVEKNDLGVITGLKATICVTCHDGEHALFVSKDLIGTTQDIWNGVAAVPTVVTQQMADDTAAEIEHEAEGFHESLTVLEQYLLSKGLTYGGYPYFSGASWINEGIFGAAHNFVYLHHEGGAYAHNRYYAKRLIFDSIDWLDNGVLDGIINIDALTYPAAGAWLGAAESADPAAVPPVALGDAPRP